jgi:hypothetical protein
VRWLVNYAPLLQLLATLILAGLTAWYVILTRKLAFGQHPACLVPERVSAAESSRNLEHGWDLTMANSGTAAALDVRVSAMDLDDSAKSLARALKGRLSPAQGPYVIEPGKHEVYQLGHMLFWNRIGVDEAPVYVSWRNMNGGRERRQWLFRPQGNPQLVPMDVWARLAWWRRRVLGRPGVGS